MAKLLNDHEFQRFSELQQKQASFFPEIPVVIRVDSAQQHYHVPLLLSPFAYSTYRGS